MVKCSIPTTLTMAYFTVSEDLLFYACPLPLSKRKKLDAYLLLLEKSSAGKYLKQISFDSEADRPKRMEKKRKLQTYEIAKKGYRKKGKC